MGFAAVLQHLLQELAYGNHDLSQKQLQQPTLRLPLLVVLPAEYQQEDLQHQHTFIMHSNTFAMHGQESASSYHLVPDGQHLTATSLIIHINLAFAAAPPSATIHLQWFANIR